MSRRVLLGASVVMSLGACSLLSGVDGLTGGTAPVDISMGDADFAVEASPNGATDAAAARPCTSAAECPAPPPCNVAACIANRCETTPVPQNTACGAGGACDGRGACIECTPAAKGCAGAVPRTCGSDSRWVEGAACSGATPVCSQGVCVAQPPSCVGLEANCGNSGTENCCATIAVPAGTYQRSNETAHVATVSAFVLDRYEVTVGRFRKFVAGYPGDKPAPGDGGHPKIPDSGWNAGWDAFLAADAVTLARSLRCGGGTNGSWRDAPTAAQEIKPISCVDWYAAFAFCSWDGGRLPTEAEWNAAAAGEQEQRTWPWGDTPPDSTYAVFGAGTTFTTAVGSKSPKGDGRWGHADLAGNLGEWVLDWSGAYPNPCVDCANLTAATSRVVRGGSWNYSAGSDISTGARNAGGPAAHNDTYGFRCARQL